ncbi:hypothetical protein L7F22_046470 [Adiantum nelumboides]|nr:hypothetical protein [Adiantum nelumboides]
MEHFRPKPDPFPSSKGESDGDAPSLVFQNKKRSLQEAGHAASAADAWAGFEEEDRGEWEETFAGRQDSKPKGPEALSLDIEFPGKANIFGLPEHASPLNLRNTRGQKDGDFHEPYRLMNTDVFEYDADSPMSLYGSVPVVHAVQPGSAASVLWLWVLRLGSTLTVSRDHRATRRREHISSLNQASSTSLSSSSLRLTKIWLSSRRSSARHLCRPTSPWDTTSADGIIYRPTTS